MIRICGPKDKAPPNAFVLNTTSQSKDWARAFSPFLLGPVNLYDGLVAKNVENGWQFSKVYPQHLKENGFPSPDYFKWAQAGWNSTYAHRYPMGKGAKPAYSYWKGHRLDYISARKQIYIPLYTQAVRNTDLLNSLAHAQLCAAESGKDTWLWDFDGYDHVKHGIALTDVVNQADRKMGHAFVIAMMMENLV